MLFCFYECHSTEQNNEQTTNNKQRSIMAIATTFQGWPMAKICLPRFEELEQEEEEKINTWKGPDGNTYEHDPISNILYDIDNGDYLGDKDEFEEYLERIERFQPWTAPNGKTYNLDPKTNEVYHDDTRTNLGNVDVFEKEMKEEMDMKARKQYEQEPHIMIDNWGGPIIDVRNAGSSTDFVVNELVNNIIRLRNIDPPRAKILRAFVSFRHV